MKRITDVSNRKEFADFLGINLRIMNSILYGEKPGVNSYYEVFSIPKKSGGLRIITAPDADLKKIQDKLASKLLEHKKYIREENNIKVNISHGFEKNKSILTNAKIHVNKRYLLNIDLKDFFPTIHFGRVRGYFQKNKYFKLNNEIATLIAQLSCCEGKLPQGAPTSPIIANMICEILDLRILKLCKKYKVDYTRYADDLSFSTNDRNFLLNKDNFLEEVNQEITHAGFSINTSKTRLAFRNSKQTVTGLVVNKKVNIDNLYYKRTRAMANELYKTGHAFDGEEELNIKNIEGRFSFVNHIDHMNNDIDLGDNVAKHNFYSLNGREKQFQKFLFYKYFFANEKPLIVTEGKTDILYLKAALKSLYLEYPELIELTEDYTFKYKISFLKKSKKLKYFFNFPEDGASIFTDIYGFYGHTDKKNSKNYSNYINQFKKLSDSLPKNPVFMLFDNEMSSKKPLGSFLEKFKFDEDRKQFIEDNLYINLSDNLYLSTVPMNDNDRCKNSNETDIEDLFSDVVLEKIIGGKSFHKKEKGFNPTKHYGKEIFSKFVYSYYEDIDFTNFKPILNNIRNIISMYSSVLKN